MDQISTGTGNLTITSSNAPTTATTGSTVPAAVTALLGTKSVSDVKGLSPTIGVKVTPQYQEKKLRRQLNSIAVEKYRKRQREKKIEIKLKNEQLKKEWLELKSEFPEASGKIKYTCQGMPKQNESLPQLKPSVSATKGQAAKNAYAKAYRRSKKLELGKIKAENEDLEYKIGTLKKEVLCRSSQESEPRLPGVVPGAIPSKQISMGMGSLGTSEEPGINADTVTSVRCGKRKRTSDVQNDISITTKKRNPFPKEGDNSPLVKLSSGEHLIIIRDMGAAQVSRGRSKLCVSSLKKENEEMKEQMPGLNKELEAKDKKIRELEEQAQRLIDDYQKLEQKCIEGLLLESEPSSTE